MPRARAIFHHDVALESVIGDIPSFMWADRALRRRYWNHASKTLGLDEDAGLAFVRLEDGVFMKEHCKRALVFCPFRPGLNEDLKTLGPARIRYENRYSSWVVRVDTDEAAMLLIRKLLKFLDAVILQNGEEAALLNYKEHWNR